MLAQLLLSTLDFSKIRDLMSRTSSHDVLQNLWSDTRHFFRDPQLVVVTSALVVLLLVFIVFPIGTVLLKSFTVTFPTVTVIYQNKMTDRAEAEKNVTRMLVDIFKSLQGLEKVRATTTEKSSVVMMRFQKNWDDMRGLNDAKKALKNEDEKLAPYVEKTEFKLGQETINSFATYVEFFSKRYYWEALKNSILLAILTTILVVCIAFCFAHLGLRGPDIFKGPLRLLSLLPLIAPPFIFALSLIVIGGRKGILTKAFMLPFHIYGWPGVIIAQTITFLPLGYLMIENVLRSLSPNLDEAASDMGASDLQILFKITIPLAAPGILKAALLVFIMSIADFGNPMLIGGGVPFLATKAYFLWISEANLEMAAVFCVFLVIPSMIIFIVHEYILKGKMYTTIGGKPQQTEKKKISPTIVAPMMVIATPVSLMVLLCFGVIFVGAFTKILMIDNSFTLAHFETQNGIRSLMSSLKFAFSAALIAPVIGISLSYILVRKRIPLKRALEFVALLGFAVPGTVMGVGYILAFNSPPLKLTGTFAIMVLNEAFRNLSVGLEAGVSKLQQVDVSIEEAAVDMGASAFQTFIKIVLPLISSAFVAGFIYTFMVGMIAVSAVIFLISPGNYLASLYILSVAEEGFLGMACAISVMLILVVLACLGALRLLAKYTKSSVF
jgi:iron(III) transport system permease protein